MHSFLQTRRTRGRGRGENAATRNAVTRKAVEAKELDAVAAVSVPSSPVSSPSVGIAPGTEPTPDQVKVPTPDPVLELVSDNFSDPASNPIPAKPSRRSGRKGRGGARGARASAAPRRSTRSTRSNPTQDEEVGVDKPVSDILADSSITNLPTVDTVKDETPRIEESTQGEGSVKELDEKIDISVNIDLMTQGTSIPSPLPHLEQADIEASLNGLDTGAMDQSLTMNDSVLGPNITGIIEGDQLSSPVISKQKGSKCKTIKELIEAKAQMVDHSDRDLKLVGMPPPSISIKALDSQGTNVDCVNYADIKPMHIDHVKPQLLSDSKEGVRNVFKKTPLTNSSNLDETIAAVAAGNFTTDLLGGVSDKEEAISAAIFSVNENIYGQPVEGGIMDAGVVTESLAPGLEKKACKGKKVARKKPAKGKLKAGAAVTEHAPDPGKTVYEFQEEVQAKLPPLSSQLSHAPSVVHPPSFADSSMFAQQQAAVVSQTLQQKQNVPMEMSAPIAIMKSSATLYARSSVDDTIDAVASGQFGGIDSCTPAAGIRPMAAVLEQPPQVVPPPITVQHVPPCTTSLYGLPPYQPVRSTYSQMLMSSATFTNSSPPFPSPISPVVGNSGQSASSNAHQRLLMGGMPANHSPATFLGSGPHPATTPLTVSTTDVSNNPLPSSDSFTTGSASLTPGSTISSTQDMSEIKKKKRRKRRKDEQEPEKATDEEVAAIVKAIYARVGQPLPEVNQQHGPSGTGRRIKLTT